jgi:rhamnogalacturonan acetylesterase
MKFSAHRLCLSALGAMLMFSQPTRAEDDRPIVDDKDVPKEQPLSEKLPTFWLAGDSTLNSKDPMRGWAQEIGTFFDPKKIQVVNRAIGGRSSRTFFGEGRWDQLLSGVKKGDIVLVQFGHNDVGPLDDKGKFRGSIKGTGDETQDVTKPDGTVETVHSFGWYLRTYARTAKEKGATVILCSPIPHKKFDAQGKLVPDWVEWRGWVKESAKKEGAEFIDLTEAISAAYEKLGKEEVEKLFADKGTHTNAQGAQLNAKAVILCLEKLPGKPLDAFLSPQGKEIKNLP